MMCWTTEENEDIFLIYFNMISFKILFLLPKHMHSALNEKKKIQYFEHKLLRKKLIKYRLGSFFFLNN